MNWLENNLVGKALLGFAGTMVVAGVGLTLAWNGPVSSGASVEPVTSQDLPALPAATEELGEIDGYQMINDRPLFNASRRPQIVIAEEDSAETEEQPQLELAVAEAPEVVLTGVVITPDQRVVTLTPKGGGESVVIRQGMPMEGEYVGWTVTDVAPRLVRLESSDGEYVEVQLQVHDAMIKEPPKPEPERESESPQQVASADGGEAPGGENLSRAEQIRQRIQERREQLRAEAEQRQEDEGDEQENKRSAYQEAIQSMMQRRNDNDEEGDSDNE